MAEIDMIPRSYHEAQRIRVALKRFSQALLVLLAAGALAFAGVRWQMAVEAPRLARLRAATDAAEAARAQQATLKTQKAALEQRLAMLSALRGAGDVAQAMTAIDAALRADVWFRELHFARIEQVMPTVAPGTPPAPPMPDAPDAGFVVVLPTDVGGKPSPTETQTWRLGKAIEISAYAQDHAAMSGFLQRLGAQPGIADVHFLNSSVHSTDGAKAPVVEFNLSASARSRQGGGA